MITIQDHIRQSNSEFIFMGEFEENEFSVEVEFCKTDSGMEIGIQDTLGMDYAELVDAISEYVLKNLA